MTSKIKVDNINKVSDDSNIINKCGTTITLGASGDSIALASGASQTGFGRTGTVDWQTSSIKTSTFTAANGEGYFADTSSGAFTMNLPAGTAGNIVSVVDYTNTFQTNSLTIAPNGSQKIGGFAATVSLNTEGQSVTFVYVDDTEGWKNTMDSTSNVIGNPFVTATGGTETTSGNFKIHTFTGPGTFTVTSGGQPGGSTTVDYLVIGGGGSGGSENNSSTSSGGGGSGGYRFSNGTASGCYSAGPGPLGASALPVTAQGYPITVGAGGVSTEPAGTGVNGSNSIFSSITSAGGGGGGGFGPPPNFAGLAGGSGGGGAQGSPGGAGNTPPVSPSQGNAGGDAPSCFPSGGGGGAGAVGTQATPSQSGPGGAGLTSCISASPVTRGGGGGGGGVTNRPATSPPASGGSGGGGAGGAGQSAGNAATINTGGGGGGAGNKYPSYSFIAGGTGGSGIVIIRYKFQ